MRRLCRVLICTVLIVFFFSSVTYAQPVTVTATRAVLIAQGYDELIYSKSADARHAPASLTKVMTVVLAIELGDLDDKVIVSEQAPFAGGSSLYIKAGEVYTLRDLLYAALLISANDACAAIAEHLGGSISGFAEMMNTRAKELGMASTNFENPHGMPSANHYSTARDLSVLGLHAASIPLYREIASTGRYTLSTGRAVSNQNKLLGNNGVIAGKTGYTIEAGQCLLTIAEQAGLTLVSVVLGAQGAAIWSDTTALLEYGFSNYKQNVLVRDKQTIGLTRIPLAGEVLMVAKGQVTQVTKSNHRLSLSNEIKLKPGLFPPLKPGQEIGELIVSNSGLEVGRVAITVPVYIPLVTSVRIIGILCTVALLAGFISFRRRVKS